MESGGLRRPRSLIGRLAACASTALPAAAAASVYKQLRQLSPQLSVVGAHGIAKDHPFLDGNKRTSLVGCELFLNLNGIELTASDEAVVMTWLKLASGDISEVDLEAWITKNSRRMSKAK
jgi:death-on-curing family protein